MSKYKTYTSKLCTTDGTANPSREYKHYLFDSVPNIVDVDPTSLISNAI